MKLEWGWEDVKEEHEREKEELRQQIRNRDFRIDEQGRLLDEQNRKIRELIATLDRLQRT